VGKRRVLATLCHLKGEGGLPKPKGKEKVKRCNSKGKENEVLFPGGEPIQRGGSGEAEDCRGYGGRKRLKVLFKSPHRSQVSGGRGGKTYLTMKRKKKRGREGKGPVHILVPHR